ncbi:tRNA uridine-5-carboxymethylaminomethyl(34) synthesis GTPase MnmE [Rubellicoccus peritrichatus]|uniref:tRNA modification GTPase MnmE n=1 Tax=Rubellicoccus peritrichatus TaxID=3080537 RepID=A0AAQ3LBI6_9BACT|nr:tRNA uridine-5-carboxymethylaminomethyl(34) synthesis GTPase MnmE [Puniceicoccus sp. CR14]WOO42267.1 tRNA uridine-5-carboxymethylaminomethyl(34) synthesis GTPase MnmE [Puniceicoccus sp. CR14]
MPLGETIVSLSTPHGESAIAVIRLSGPDCSRLAQECFKESRGLEPRVASLRHYLSLRGDKIDDVVALYFADGKSYTGEPMLELSCHGNPFVIQRLMEDLVARGCRMAEPGEYTRTAFLNGKLDLAQAEAVADLISARSERAIEMARRQLDGALGSRVAEYVDQLLSIQANIEAYIDFPEEDLPEENEAGPIQDLAKLSTEFSALIQTANYKESLSEGINTVIAGAPNAGKSSLLNLLVGEDRAIVSAEPGTTRDYITERIIAGPYTLKITDTAGIHKASDNTEALGIEKTVQRLSHADLVLLVIDSADDPPTLPDEALELIAAEKCLVIENKTDLAASKDRADYLPELRHIRVSATSGEGIDGIRKQVVDLLEAHEIVPHPDSLVVNARHATALYAARDAVDAARTKLINGEPTELAGSDMRMAVDALEQIVGEIDNEAMLDRLFSAFCIGK